MLTLGINAAFHDSSAVLVVDGRVVAAAEEERFTRVKHAKRALPFTAWELPFNAIDYCLAQAGVRLPELDHVAYSFSPQRFMGGRTPSDRVSLPGEVKNPWDSPWDPLFAAYVSNAPGMLADGAPHHLRARFAGATADGPYRFHFVDHHLSHQASAFLAAPFERCAVMTLDGRGEDATTSYGVYRDNAYLPLGDVCMPHSLGLLYERVTTHLGFLNSSDEYKVMAMAAMGTPRWRDLLQQQILVGPDGRYKIAAFELAELFGPPRLPGTAVTRRCCDLAASLQAVLESTVLQLATWLRETSREPRLALAGGVALNCVMNSRLRDAGIFERVWIQPAAGDAGTALGAALWIDSLERQRRADISAWATDASKLAPRVWTMQHAYLGPDADDTQIESLLRWAKLPFRKENDIVAAVARLLADGKVVGWYQGRMEFGPRALGARSILASPVEFAMQARINELKDREDFRPVAPAVPEELLAQWFRPAVANGGSAPFMLFTYDVIPELAQRIPAACHSDGSARVQTVTDASNPRFHALLHAFGNITGVPVLINTSFNVRGEPIVGSVKDAIDAFHSTPIDALAIGSFLLVKPGSMMSQVAEEVPEEEASPKKS